MNNQNNGVEFFTPMERIEEILHTLNQNEINQIIEYINTQDAVGDDSHVQLDIIIGNPPYNIQNDRSDDKPDDKPDEPN